LIASGSGAFFSRADIGLANITIFAYVALASLIGRFLHALQADQLLAIGQLDQGHTLSVARQAGHFRYAGAHQGTLVGDQHDLFAIDHLHGADQRAVAVVGDHGDHALAATLVLREVFHGCALAEAMLGSSQDLAALLGNQHGDQALAFSQAHAANTTGGTAHGAHVGFI